MRKLLFGMAIVSTMAFKTQPLEPHPPIRGAIAELQEARRELQSNRRISTSSSRSEG